MNIERARAKKRFFKIRQQCGIIWQHCGMIWQHWHHLTTLWHHLATLWHHLATLWHHLATLWHHLSKISNNKKMCKNHLEKPKRWICKFFLLLLGVHNFVMNGDREIRPSALESRRNQLSNPPNTASISQLI